MFCHPLAVGVPLTLAALLAAGCGGSGPQTYPVTGTVTYRGQPLADADVTFLPASGPMASARTDAQGRFQLTTFLPGAGAVAGATAGQYSVLIVKKEKVVTPQGQPYPYEVTRSVLPARYGLADQSGLTATVSDKDKNDFTFPLTD